MNLKEEHIHNIANQPDKSKKLEIISSNIAASFIQDTAKYKIEIFTDLFYDLIEFCLVKGFSLLEIVRCCSIFYELLEHTKQTNSHLSTVIELFALNLKSLNYPLNTNKTNQFIEYMNKTLLSHFTLYKYVLSIERDKFIKQDERDLFAPSKDLIENVCLKDSIIFSQWEQKQKKLEYERKEKELLNKYKAKRERLERNEDMAKNLILFVQNDAYGHTDALDEHLIKKMIDDYATPLISVVSEQIKNDYEESKEKGAFYIQNKKPFV